MNKLWTKITTGLWNEAKVLFDLIFLCLNSFVNLFNLALHSVPTHSIAPGSRSTLQIYSHLVDAELQGIGLMTIQTSWMSLRFGSRSWGKNTIQIFVRHWVWMRACQIDSYYAGSCPPWPQHTYTHITHSRSLPLSNKQLMAMCNSNPRTHHPMGGAVPPQHVQVDAD